MAGMKKYFTMWGKSCVLCHIFVRHKSLCGKLLCVLTDLHEKEKFNRNGVKRGGFVK